MKKKKITAFDVFNTLFWIVMAFVSIFPIYLIIANALSSEVDIKEFGYAVYPLTPTLDAFKYILKAPADLLYGLRATLVYAVGGSIVTVFVCAMMGYVLTRKEFCLKGFSKTFLLVPMFISAGLIPSYIVNTQVFGLDDNWLIYLIPSVAGTGVFVYRAFFQQIPESLIESAEIDGATQFTILRKIIIPLSLPILATQLFMGISGRWKDYMQSLYYMSDPKMQVLEHYIQNILLDATSIRQNLESLGYSADSIPVETMRFAVVVIAMIPMLIIFPFFQKQFKKGAIVGGVKG